MDGRRKQLKYKAFLLTTGSETYTIAPLMQPLIPEFLDFVQKADHGTGIKGVCPVSRMQRLAAMLLDDSGSVAVDVQFGRQGKLRTLGGELSANLNVVCQRCLQPMQYTLQTRMNLALIRDDADADALPAGLEPLLLEADEMNLAAVIEDELLLALPLVLVHEQDCSDFLQQQAQRQKQEAVMAAEQKVKTNPFAVLKDLHKE
ncbi:MAG: hypothetical protein QG652_1577 [Pseudomonadota bacterium]|nr:hypothetical protein [Pseudomonadota bacterium]